ncbi:aspartate aminotransferase family protein [Empedobacter stercoris]|uniref:aspartate aminotransferase family protein n=1 Tax=Empedobacter TaxID=59734 RepID=UPI0016627C5F|nr:MULTISPECIES: aminotransferase class III-fold pyridoxal phosphate-dependent enzyme [Empedobacter]MCA4809340.1 aspartate aminotransferase family protein [Empedobacter stercoris]MDM1522697.1 aspartate aminotransferase family protein [Empedobacter sp. 225-1]MDM1543792.1 aspartate aminotransferase family protein [Empedobacter sp. 189-2]QNT14807.1 aspartate aminotransferase family protein [Empedobacter stercoris]
MKLFDVYPLMNVTPVKAKDCILWDENGKEYLDLYGGHAVISIGHAHPHYVQKITEQVNNIGFYSNSVQIPIQTELAEKLGRLSGYEDYTLFLCNSGAEANENAAKLASFHTGKDRIIAFNGAFHGRTSGSVALTDNPKIVAPFNAHHKVSFVDYNIDAIKEIIAGGDVAAIIYEPIQGVGGIVLPSDEFVQELRNVCTENGVILIADEVQCGYGRSGKFFAHQHSDIKADLITMAKGMGNGFPIGGVLISPEFKASYGLLGTTFGGNHLACAAAVAVLDVIEQENLIDNAKEIGNYIGIQLNKFPKIKEVRGRGSMIGIEFDFPIAALKNNLLTKHNIFVGYAGTNVIRLLPPLTITTQYVDKFISALETEINIIING